MLIENLFPHLTDPGYEIISPPSVEYNCVAWARSRHSALAGHDPLHVFASHMGRRCVRTQWALEIGR